MSRTHEADPHRATPAELCGRYDAEKRRVDEARRRMLRLTAAPHRAAEVRAAADELTRALRGATALANRALQEAGTTAAAPSRLSGLCRRHRKATRTVPPAIGFWTAELLRLADVQVWLRRETLDDLGVHLPAAVRVGSRAANGPRIAGLVAEPDDLVAATLHQPCIGVDLQATVDAAVDEPTSSLAPPGVSVPTITKAA